MKFGKKFMLLFVIAILIILGITYYFGGNYSSDSYPARNNYSSNSKYKWITDGTCSSHGMQDLTQNDCSKYLLKSNYNITVADHGPPGCWLVLGEMLDQTMNEQPQFAGKGFACWSQNKSDGKQCSANIPCACK